MSPCASKQNKKTFRKYDEEYMLYDSKETKKYGKRSLTEDIDLELEDDQDLLQKVNKKQNQTKRSRGIQHSLHS